MSNGKIFGLSFAAGLAASLVYGYFSSKKDEKKYVLSDDDTCEDVEEVVESEDEDSSKSETSESETEHVQAETVDVDPTATVDNKTVDVDSTSTGKESNNE